MFENVLYQSAAEDIAQSLKNGSLPNALLFAGEKASAKFTTALELARGLSCSPESVPKEARVPRGRWDCACPSCLRHKQLVSPGLLIAGPRYCMSEAAAAQKTLLEARAADAPYTQAARFLFIRSVRKLTARFSPELWAGDDKAAKIAGLADAIGESLEELNPSRCLPGDEKLRELTGGIMEHCARLEADFLYAALPVSHVRAISSWARFTPPGGKKTVIIENADRMQDSARNALLKILEEPPKDTVFVLTTTNRQALMPTILSRVRTCRFVPRTKAQQADVLKRVFHAQGDFPSVAAYLDSFLPVSPQAVSALGADFLARSIAGEAAGVKALCAGANNFEPPPLLAAFFDGMTSVLKARCARAAGVEKQRETEFAARCLRAASEAKTRMALYNQNPAAALELLQNEIAESREAVF
jgi:DNA polymerase-3 subunit gamma/tau